MLTKENKKQLFTCKKLLFLVTLRKRLQKQIENFTL